MTGDDAAVIEVLVSVDRVNAINCTGPDGVGCEGRNEWHTRFEHRLHVAEAQVEALRQKGLLP